MIPFLIVFISLFPAIIISSPVFGESISNISVEITPDDMLVIQYDLEGSGISTVGVSVSLDSGNSFPIKPIALSGDVGGGVRPGKGKKITWDVFMDIKRLAGDLAVKVTAQSGDADSGRNDIAIKPVNFYSTPCVAGEKRVVEGIAMVSIHSGTFLMGSTDGQSDEKPVHLVTVSAFEMSATKVTVRQFKKFVKATGYRTEAENGDGAFVWTGKWEKNSNANWKNTYLKQGDEHPVVCVSWNDAVAFCGWLSKEAGGNFRLPTEAEWEYACRAGTTTKYYTGDSNSCLAQAGWYLGNSGDTTHPVGQKTPNAFGLYDMHGNVWDWCDDCYSSYPSDNQTNPICTQNSSFRVLRGGGWNIFDSYCRSAGRNYSSPSGRFDSVGFRVVRQAQQ